MHQDRLIRVREKKTTSNISKYVIYWMQQSQRVHFNHALNHAIELANKENLPLVVYFGLWSGYPDANIRHFKFMLEGLKEVKHILNHFGINFVLKIGKPEISLLPLLDDAHALVMDQGYLKHQKIMREYIINQSDINLNIDIVDTDLIVPVHIASNKVEYGAYTLRPKLKKLYLSFRDFKRIETIENKTVINLRSDHDLADIDGLLNQLELDRSVKPSSIYHGGYVEATKLFTTFVTHKINHYLESSDPSTNYTSLMSMYLHFGQISSLDILERLFLLLNQNQIDGQSFDAYVEQLLVRRELAFNYVYYQEGYNQFDRMTESWAYMTMNEHAFDKRDYLYSPVELELAQTHDVYFNAAMKEMYYTGYMHNYMRMYWAKKIIEWMPSYKEAYDTILYLNNKYFIDGRDANSYAGVAWCFGKHDRAWTERKIFGKLRYMNANGLERKFNILSYIDKVNEIILL
ncbi:MAG: deoxyribodipyrimidine photo-lyase [Acholeplasmataceae bacterium]|jgi:deoxyribodipyrimidine photo-lyase|nr:deoxyribodipyrimidine photo-lyase [Acholeplasmataceae bacterium]